MKKLSLIILITALVFNVNAQLKKSDNVLSINGIYNIINTGSGVYNNSLSEKKHSLVVGASLSFLGNHFLYGFGLDYYNEYDLKVFRTSIAYKYSQHEKDIVNSSIFLPNAYIGYYTRIVDKLYFTTNLKFSIGELNSTILSSTVLDDYDTDYTTTTNVKISDKMDYAIAALQPELTYFISNKIGLSLYTGGIEYSFTDWDPANSNLIINFNPNSWQVGLKILL